MNPSAFNQGMFSPFRRPMNQTLVPVGGYGTGTPYIPMGSQMFTPTNGYAVRPRIPPVLFGEPVSRVLPSDYNPADMNPYAGMFSPFMQQPILYNPFRQSQLTGGTPDVKNPTGNAMFTNQEFFDLLSRVAPIVGTVRGVGDTLDGAIRFFNDRRSSLGRNVSPTGSDINTPF
jgi:hypothetical protein